ncbi:type II toxin-antitoxin system YhaV family toxin [Pectobacterium brasiliense]|uniref:type II toxin-antitoxin system YhaV family toxin n=1 Tax=Pectobacterium brasiliense TaxID=180957 RepID=UPI00094A8A26|nr:type II toxin-antitoxin system YhaV family toxin [Pectobacterium brasiliense]APS31782.1 toxin YhaV [Pectobacterium brasiliense]MBN3130712.1 type II toxin-antitoxin system YhaV family toxin [Pectobacterium brasiliense]WJM80141.1 type II toxin-antitoxin system YhaV family toxin [Pectobacterium brasiliense]
MVDKRVINGWQLFTHPCFDAQFESLIVEVEQLRKKHPESYQKKQATKLLAAIVKVIRTEICGDPSQTKFRQGDTLGEGNKHWFRAKFLGQYRLFFRYSERHKTIILAWVNDSDTKRAYGDQHDAYKVFSGMLASGNPPGDWEQLLAESHSEAMLTQMLVRP